jgi:protein TonB
MAYGRIEATPAEQLKALRETRDRYAARADRLRESTDLDPEIKLAEERNARRIAHAYEKSIANSVARMSDLGHTHQFTLPSLGTRTWLTFFIAISAIEGALLLAYFRPAIFQIGPAAPQSASQRLDRVASLPKPVTQAPPVALAPKPVAQPKAPPPAAIAPKPIAQPKPPPPIAVTPKPSAQRQTPPPIAIAPKPSAQPQAPPPIAVAPKPVAQPQAPPPSTPLSAATFPQPVAQPPSTPPSAATAPQPSAQPANPPPIASFVVPTAPPRATAPPPPQVIASVPTRLEPIAQTHSLPPYPTIARSLGEDGTTQMRVAISIQGAPTDCEIVKTSGSPRLDATACNYVLRHWRWNPPLRNGQPVTVSTEISIVWNLKTAR